MRKGNVMTVKGENFSAVQVGAFDRLNDYKFTHERLDFEIEGKLFLHQLLGLTSAEISLNKMPPKTSMPFYHTHRNNEEVYLFVGGTGEFEVDGQRIPVSEGTVVRVAPHGVRCWRNNSDQPLYYIVIQAPFGGFTGDGSINDGVGVEKRVEWND
ncbi:MAG: cupin domain-containing protein [Geobacteraceae bacterium]|nr:cupin domain-containing protein [Geobacteraceae bacterium]